MAKPCKTLEQVNACNGKPAEKTSRRRFEGLHDLLHEQPLFKNSKVAAFRVEKCKSQNMHAALKSSDALRNFQFLDPFIGRSLNRRAALVVSCGLSWPQLQSALFERILSSTRTGGEGYDSSVEGGGVRGIAPLPSS